MANTAELMAWLDSTGRWLAERSDAVRATGRGAERHVADMLFVGPAGDRARDAAREIRRGLDSVADELRYMSSVCRGETDPHADPALFPVDASHHPLHPPMILPHLPGRYVPDRWRSGPRVRIELDPAGVVHTCARLRAAARSCQEHQTLVTSRLADPPRQLRPVLRQRFDTCRRGCSLTLERAARRLNLLAADLAERARTPGMAGEMFASPVTETLGVHWHTGAVAPNRGKTLAELQRPFIERADHLQRTGALLVREMPREAPPVQLMPSTEPPPGQRVALDPLRLAASGVVFAAIASDGVATPTRRARQRVTKWAAEP